MAAAGESVDAVARALKRTRVSVRSQATHNGISFAHRITGKSPSVYLPPDLALRLRLAARALGDIAPQKLARDLLSSLLSEKTRDAAIQAELAKAAQRSWDDALVVAQPPAVVPAPASPLFVVFAPQLYGSML